MILLLESKMVRVWSGKGNSPKYERDVGQPYHHFENNSTVMMGYKTWLKMGQNDNLVIKVL